MSIDFERSLLLNLNNLNARLRHFEGFLYIYLTSGIESTLYKVKKSTSHPYSLKALYTSKPIAPGPLIGFAEDISKTRFLFCIIKISNEINNHFYIFIRQLIKHRQPH